MNIAGAWVGGLIAGLIGAAVWAGVTYTTHYEIGWIAWGIGALVGFGVMLGARQGNTVSGIMAIVISLASIAGGKYIAVELDVNKALSEATAGMDFTNDTYVTSYLADEEIDKLYADNQEPTFPAGADLENPDGPEDYPADVWARAQSRWSAMTAEEQAAYRDDQRTLVEAGMAEFKTLYIQEAFKDSFSAMDLLFGALAVATAFKLGSGSREETADAAGS